MKLLKAFRVIFACFIAAAALFFCLSGPLHEAEGFTKPLFGHAKVQLAGSKYSTGCREMTAVISAPDLELMKYFTELESADFSGSTCYDEIAEWAAGHPEVHVRFSVPLPNGRSAFTDSSELDLTWLTDEDTEGVISVLPYFSSLETVELDRIGTETLSADSFSKLKNAFPELSYKFNAEIDGKPVDASAVSIDLSSLKHQDAVGVAAVISCLPNLKTVTLGTQSSDSDALKWEDIALFKASCPDAHFVYSFSLYGQELDLDAEKLDFSHTEVNDNGDALYSVLTCMNNCKYLDMDSTGVSDEAMEKIRDLFPQVKVVWRVWFGDNYSVRTDTERILASKPTVGGMIYDPTPLKYCTDVKYLDLGHNEDMPNIDFAAYMPKLEVLIVAMTGITDISPLKNCPHLEYIELNTTNISDLSPLENCTELRHLNIACCPEIKDISMLKDIPLDRFWIGNQTPVPYEQVKAYADAHPDCDLNTTTEDPHGECWRYTRYDPEEPKYYWVPRHELLREQMGYNYQEYSFYWLDPLCGLEAPDEYKGMYGREVYG